MSEDCLNQEIQDTEKQGSKFNPLCDNTQQNETDCLHPEIQDKEKQVHKFNSMCDSTQQNESNDNKNSKMEIYTEKENKEENKSKRRDLSLKQKSDLLKTYDTLPKCSQREAALKLGISQSSLCKLIKQRHKIDEEIANNANVSRKRKRDGKSCNVETALLQWFKSANTEGAPISRAILMEKAAQFAEILEEDFVPTDGWLTRWKERHNIVYPKYHREKQGVDNRLADSWMTNALPGLLNDYKPHQIYNTDETALLYKALPQHYLKEECGEKPNVDYESVDNWMKNILPNLLKDYKPHQIYNTDETSLFFRALPQHTFMFKSGSLAFFKKVKQHVTILLTCNWDGTIKKTPIVIGTSKNPRCFRGVKNLPVEYFNNKNAVMTTKIFTDFLLKWDEDLKDEKVLLFLDNCSAHPSDVSLENIKLVFLPADITCVIQPLAQGIIKTFKCYYRKDIVRKVINDIDTCEISTFTLNEISKSISLLDALHMLYNAWEAVTAKTIKNCFRKCGFYLEESQDLLNVTDVEEDNYDEYFLEYVDIDKNLPTTWEKISHNIVEVKKETKQEECDENESDMEVEGDVCVPTAAETRMALQILRRTLELKGGDSKSYQQFYALENTIENLLMDSTKQSAIDS